MQKVVTYFYTVPENIQNGMVRIKGEEAHHITKVLRYKKGEIISVVDGCGLRYKEILEPSQKDWAEGKNLDQVRRENEPVANLTLACGISSGTKMDLIIEKCTELGVRSFIPILTEKGMVELDELAKVKKKLGRWNKVALAAMKQSLRCYLPLIENPLDLGGLLRKAGDYDRSLIASLGPKSKTWKEALEAEEPLRDVLLLVGSEAGFTEEESNSAQEGGFIPVKLGPRRLRTETACIIFCGLVLSHLGELE